MAERKKLRKASESDEMEVAGELQHEAARPGGVHTRNCVISAPPPGSPYPIPLTQLPPQGLTAGLSPSMIHWHIHIH